MNSTKFRYVVIVLAIAIITISYWLFADPPTPWIFAFTAAGLLIGIITTLSKKRAGKLT